MSSDVSDGAAASTDTHQQGSGGKSKLTAGIFVFWGILAVIGGLAFVAFADAMSGLPAADILNLAEFGIVFALVFFLFAAIDIATGYGIWNRTEWSWYAGVIVAGLSSLLWIWSIVRSFDFLSLVFLVAALFCVYALYDERSQFGVGA